jgi:hypothetical protein
MNIIDKKTGLDVEVLKLLREQEEELRKYNVEDWLTTAGSEKKDRLKYAGDLEYSYYYCDDAFNKKIDFYVENKLLEHNLSTNARVRVPKHRYKDNNGGYNNTTCEIPLDALDEDGNYINQDLVYNEYNKQQQEESNTTGYRDSSIAKYKGLDLLNNEMFTTKQRKYMLDCMQGMGFLYNTMQHQQFKDGIKKRLRRYKSE